MIYSRSCECVTDIWTILLIVDAQSFVYLVLLVGSRYASCNRLSAFGTYVRK
jgi:hypothetical protein